MDTQQILHINLTDRRIEKMPVPGTWFRDYLGGMGLAFRYLWEYLGSTKEPLSPETPVILMPGLLAGTLAPSASRLAFVSWSPKTGTVFESNVGGSVGAEIRYAGYAGIVIAGKSERPVYIIIEDGTVSFRDASDLWGRGIFETEREIKEREGDLEIKTLSIGPAGENLVSFACVGSECYRQLGRAGTGALFGSKNLKAIAVRGTGGVEVADLEGFMEYTKQVTRQDVLGDANKWAQTDGTPILVGFTNDLGILPTRNFRSGKWDEWHRIGTDAVKNIKVRSRACVGCPLGCGNYVEVGKARLEGPEYETLALAGSNCGISDIDAIVAFNERCDDLGLDTMSLGGTLALAMDLTAEGIHDFGLNFGDVSSYLGIPEEVALLRTDRGRAIAQGARELGRRYGKPEWAMQVKNLEMPAYDPRGNYGMGLAYATSERGACHLRAFTVFKEHPFDVDEMVGWVIRGQNFNSVKWSMGICDFWASVTPAILAKFLELTTGRVAEEGEMVRTGERIWNLMRLLNLRVGITSELDDLPGKVKMTPLRGGPTEGKTLPQDILKELLQTYYERRGWNREGTPKRETLCILGLDGLVDGGLER